MFALVFASLYKGYLADYYLIAIFPLPIILFANLLAILSKKSKVLLWLSLITILTISFFNFNNLPLRPISRTIDQIEEAARIIASDVSSKERFNLFLKRKAPFWSTAAEYRYLVEVMGKRALEPTEYRDSEILYFIAEARVSNPLKVENWEVKEFQPAKILKTWELANDIVVYKLGK